MSIGYKTGDLVDVSIEKIVPRGFGLGFAEGLTVFVPLSAPGDKLRVRIDQIKKRTAFASIVEIKGAGPGRIEPPCPVFGICGGCDMQQLEYGAQLDAKAGIIRDCLIRIGKIEHPGEIEVVPSPEPFGYRSRARWHIDRERRAIGYFRRDSHEVVDINECRILTAEMASALTYLREKLEWDTFWSDSAEVEAAADDNGSVSIFSPDLAEGTSDLAYSVNGDAYAYSAATFFQANGSLIPELIRTAVEGSGGRTALDLYSGVGLFTLPLARRFSKVIGVEESPGSVKFARRNAAAAGLENTEIVAGSVVRFLKENTADDIDFVLIDPPRSGTEKQTIAAILALGPSQISYVSCEPSILARDLSLILDGGYAIEKITAIDMFPQTHHIETVVRLSKRAGG